MVSASSARSMGGRYRGSLAWGGSGDHVLHGLQEFLQALSPAGRRPHHRDPQPPGELRKLHLDPLPLGLIQEIDAHHCSAVELQRLEDQVEVAFQAGGVAHHHRRVRPAEAEKIPGRLFLCRAGLERVGPRKIYQKIAPSPMFAPPLGSRHRLSRPVPGMLPQMGQPIEERGFPHVWVPRQGHHPVLRALPAQDPGPLHRARSGGRCGQSHAPTASPSKGSSSLPKRQTSSASARRRAMTAPRKE